MFKFIIALALGLGLCTSTHAAWWASVADVTGGGGGTAVPDYQWNLDDNAADQVVVAEYGTDGYLFSSGTVATTALLHSTSCYEGTGCFDFSNHTGYSYPRAAGIDGTSIDDDTFTIQISYNIPASPGVTTNVRMLESSSANAILAYLNSSNTGIVLYYRGNNIGTAAINAVNTGTWQVLRLVYDTGSIYVYQGASESTLSLVDTVSGTFGSGTTTNPQYISVYGQPSDTTSLYSISGVGDQIKMWNDAVTP